MNATTSGTTIAVVSPKGGVGKTTVAANLGAALVARGRPVLLLDLDPQNALRLHHQMPLGAPAGLALQTLYGQPWADALFRGPFGAECLPYGAVDSEQQRRFEQLVEHDPGWLDRGLRSLGLAPGSVILVDTPPGRTASAATALASADRALTVLLPDAASLATLPAFERWLDEQARRGGRSFGAQFLINRMNPARPLCADVAGALARRLGPRLLDVQIPFDAAVEESLASQAPIQHYAPGSATARDFDVLAELLTRTL